MSAETAPVVVVIDSAAADRDALFAEVADALLADGVVNPTYLEGLRTREAAFPTGLDFGTFAVAIPHTDAEHVRRGGLVVTRLAEPVEFNAMDGHARALSVRLGVWPLVTDAKRQMAVLGLVLRLLQEPGKYDWLLTADGDEVRSTLLSELATINEGATP